MSASEIHDTTRGVGLVDSGYGAVNPAGLTDMRGVSAIIMAGLPASAKDFSLITEYVSKAATGMQGNAVPQETDEWA